MTELFLCVFLLEDAMWKYTKDAVALDKTERKRPWNVFLTKICTETVLEHSLYRLLD